MPKNTQYIQPRTYKPWYRNAPWCNRTPDVKKEVTVINPNSGNAMTIRWPRAPNRNVQIK